MTRRLFPVLVAFAAVASAASCGQKAGVAGTGGDGATDATDGPTATAGPPATAPPVGTDTAPSGSTGGSTPPGSEPAGSAPDSGGQPGSTAPASSAPAVAAGPYEPDDNDTSGVTDEEIVIGIHAPVTGASPIPQTSFDTGKDIYWQFLADSAPDQLFGRTVRVVFRDDEFNPQRAVQVCREMVESEGAFVLIGAGGADQITACAQFAAENNVPYLSAGVNETGLDDLATYFATSLTYSEQAALIIAQLVERELTEVGLVVADTPSFDDAFDALKAAAETEGITIAYETRINKTAAEAEQLSVVQELKNTGVQGVVLLSSPLVFIGLANQGVNQGFAPTWIGPGVTSGLNAVTNFGCPGVDTGVFFNPTPQLDVIDDLDADFRAAYEAFGGGETADDIGLGLWALNKLLAAMFVATGEELGRAALMNTLVTTASFDNGIYSPVAFTEEDHFGGTGAHLLDADCAAKTYTTAAQFVEVG